MNATPGGSVLRRPAVAAMAATFALCLAGCGAQRIRSDAERSMSAGDYVQAVRRFEQGLETHPDSVTLRSGLLQARSEALARIVANAATLRAAGKLGEAERELERGKALDPKNARLEALLAELDTERRQRAALAEAEQLAANQRPDAALRVIELALKDDRRHAGLLGLQRRLEIAQRQARTAATQIALAETRPISLDFRDANLRTVLDVVSRNSGVNFILDRDIRADARVSVFIRQARVEDALDLIIGTNQLAKKVVDAQTIVVYPNTPEKQREYQEQIVRVFYLASADAKGASAFLKSMLKIREPFVDERTNMLSLREPPEIVQLAERLIALYDAGEPEVLLELEVMEINSTRLTELGVKFPDSFSLTALVPEGEDVLTLGNLRNIGRDRIAIGISGLLVNLKRQVGDFSTLANPRIRARNKERAKVLIGDKIPVITSTTGSTGFVSDSVSYLDVGLKLDVEPTVYADDEVAIKVALEVSSLGSAVKTTSGTLAYQIGTRSASTLLRLQDGETQLLAGLISRDDRTSASRVPGIGDLPMLGRLFSSQQDMGQRTELVLAITPRILRNIRRPESNETELWVGTDALPRLRMPTVVRVGANGADERGAVAIKGPDRSEPPTKGDEPTVLKPPTLGFDGPGNAKVGDLVDLKVMLSTAVPLRGMPMQLEFDPARLELINATEGDFFRQGDTATSFSSGGEPRQGRLSLGILRNQATGVTGKSAAFSLRFRTLSAGATAVRISHARAIGIGAPSPEPVLPPQWALEVR